jgi:Zn-dependent metalloprotease
VKRTGSLACIVPPDLLLQLARREPGATSDPVLDTLALDMAVRTERAENAARQPARDLRKPLFAAAVGGTPNRSVYDQQGSEDQVLGKLVRAEGQPATADPAVNEAYDGLGATYRFYWDVFQRNSIDDTGMALAGLVHFGQRYDNAFWDGAGHMFFGDGDGQYFNRFTASLDVIGHELTHGVTQHEADLAYSGQSGALNESMSDVGGVLVAQYAKQQKADAADWLIGADIVGPALAPALRSMKAPGTANAFDKQPADMDHYVHTTSDHGGVHTNSGIPNHAFYLVASTLGGYSWERAGRIWYETLRDPQLRPRSNFRTFAGITLRQAQQLYGTASPEADAVRGAWDAVKLPL